VYCCVEVITLCLVLDGALAPVPAGFRDSSPCLPSLLPQFVHVLPLYTSAFLDGAPNLPRALQNNMTGTFGSASPASPKLASSAAAPHAARGRRLASGNL
jgi:hypothetical protein